MNQFDSLFPQFAAQCAQLQLVLMPVAFVLLAAGVVSSTITGRRSPSAYLRTAGRTLAYVAVLTQLTTWGDEISAITDTTVRETLHADPAKVYQDYQQTLTAKKSSGPQKGWWDKLFDASTSIFEGVISAVLYLFGLLSSVIVFYAYLAQKFILYLGYALSPIFVGFLAVQTLRGIGVNYLLSLLGVMIWPLGWGAAAVLTSGLLQFMTDQSFLGGSTAAGAAGYGLQNFIGAAALGLWLIFSTIAAPVIIQRVIASGAQAGGALLSGAATAATTAVTSGASTAGTVGGAGGAAAAAAGIGAGAAAATVATIGSSISGSTYSPGGALLGNLAQMRGRKAPASTSQNQTESGRSSAAPSPESASPSDLTGDKRVAEILQQTKPKNQ